MYRARKVRVKIIVDFFRILFLSIAFSLLCFISPCGVILLEFLIAIVLQVIVVYIVGTNVIIYIVVNILIVLIMTIYALKTKKYYFYLLGAYCIIFFLWGSLFCCRSI